MTVLVVCDRLACYGLHWVHYICWNIHDNNYSSVSLEAANSIKLLWNCNFSLLQRIVVNKCHSETILPFCVQCKQGAPAPVPGCSPGISCPFTEVLFGLAKFIEIHICSVLNFKRLLDRCPIPSYWEGDAIFCCKNKRYLKTIYGSLPCVWLSNYF